VRLPIISGMKVVKAFSKIGFQISRQSGSHIILVKKNGQKLTVVVPKHDELATGTLLSIIAQSGMTREDFLKLVNN